MNSQKTFLTQWTAALVLGLSLPTFSVAGEHAPKAPALLSQDDLQKRLSDAKLRLLDARPRADYDLAHIPGAVWVDDKIFQELSRPEAFADQAAWAQALAPLGIASDTEVYIYDGARQHDASRIWWLLSYTGIERVGLVDGGFPTLGAAGPSCELGGARRGTETAGRSVSLQVGHHPGRDPGRDRQARDPVAGRPLGG